MGQSVIQSQSINYDLISGGALIKILDLGQHPYADTFIGKNQLHMSEPVLPLQVFMNPQSGQVQVGYIGDAEERYNLYSYSYTSSNSAFSRKHWDDYAATIKQKHSVDGLVIEIGSNDGYLAKQFQNPGNTSVLGIDSSTEMCKLARAAGITDINEVFTENIANQVFSVYGKASLILANNVFNHANDPGDFARGVRTLLTDDGVFVFEVPYWADTVISGRFDQIYHEHISYFSVKSAWNLLRRADMSIIDVEHVDYHGGSIRITAKIGQHAMPEIVARYIQDETTQGLFEWQTYSRMHAKMQVDRNNWLMNFYSLRNQEHPVIIGVGAAAKANTWLNWHGLNNTVIHCITDSSPHKQGKFTPLTRIPIFGDEEFANHDNPYALILSWNISTQLKEAILEINPRTRFISQ